MEAATVTATATTTTTCPSFLRVAEGAPSPPAGMSVLRRKLRWPISGRRYWSAWTCARHSAIALDRWHNCDEQVLLKTRRAAFQGVARCRSKSGLALKGEMSKVPPVLHP